ncbi:paraslipin [Niveibacterium sp. 24ML]|uniref:SPFH domain-containing protein n=1 Tax=Niveibacterium sp. 24ML TaxID=2985512 RepID=UPI00226E2005|nr:stomatin-like protein [Niveibacterium sp. 24ML]MCX9157876.1 paraslipin [Niveibacterium sp. 24ML]
MELGSFFLLGVVVVALVFASKALVVVPQQSAYVVERLGRFNETLEAGLHVLVPFVDRIAYRLTLKEVPYDVDPQVCITRDNSQVQIDGILYYQVTDARMASYGTSNFETAIEQLAKTTLRSEAGKRDLDKLLEERSTINQSVVAALDEASPGWGVKVLRYEIKDIVPPESVLKAMEKQITAEREKRALIAKSEGEKAQAINVAEGERAAAIAQSEGDKAAQVNRAQGEAQSIMLVAKASAESIRMIADAIGSEGGERAVALKVAEQYVAAFGNIAKQGNTVVVPANMGDLASLITGAMAVMPKAAAKG